MTEPNFLFPFPESVFCKYRDGRWKEGRRAGRGLELRYVRFEVAVSCVFKIVALRTKHLFSTFENMLREHSLDSLVALGESFFRTYLENSPSLTISHTVRNPRKLGELREPVALDQQSGLSVCSVQKYFSPLSFSNCLRRQRDKPSVTCEPQDGENTAHLGRTSVSPYFGVMGRAPSSPVSLLP